MRIRRMGKDSDDFFWTFGKIHGLENIVFCDEKEVLETQGDPIALQILVNKAKPTDNSGKSFEDIELELNEAMRKYKGCFENGNYASSDRKKLLALPFYLAKRVEYPEPIRG